MLPQHIQTKQHTHRRRHPQWPQPPHFTALNTTVKQPLYTWGKRNPSNRQRQQRSHRMPKTLRISQQHTNTSQFHTQCQRKPHKHSFTPQNTPKRCPHHHVNTPPHTHPGNKRVSTLKTDIFLGSRSTLCVFVDACTLSTAFPRGECGAVSALSSAVCPSHSGVCAAARSRGARTPHTHLPHAHTSRMHTPLRASATCIPASAAPFRGAVCGCVHEGGDTGGVRLRRSRHTAAVPPPPSSGHFPPRLRRHFTGLRSPAVGSATTITRTVFCCICWFPYCGHCTPSSPRNGGKRTVPTRVSLAFSSPSLPFPSLPTSPVVADGL